MIFNMICLAVIVLILARTNNIFTHILLICSVLYLHSLHILHVCPKPVIACWPHYNPFHPLYTFSAIFCVTLSVGLCHPLYALVIPCAFCCFFFWSLLNSSDNNLKFVAINYNQSTEVLTGIDFRDHYLS